MSYPGIRLPNGRNLLVGTFSIGIEPSHFHERLRTNAVQDMIRSIRSKFHGATVIIGVDRLDCIEGLPQKLHASDEFLERHPEWVGHAILVQLTIPSRESLDVHQKLLAKVQKLVGEINGKYGKLSIPWLVPSLSETAIRRCHPSTSVPGFTWEY